MSSIKRTKGVSGFLKEHGREGNVSFHMPGHKGSRIFERLGYSDFLSGFADRDVTEIPGADNLFQPESIIAETMEKYRRLYDVPESYLLINGSSGGLIASIMTCVEAGGKIIMARNCHKSIFNGLRLGNITPVYAYPEMVEEYGISGAVSPEHIRQLVEEHPDAKAIILPSPNYYGICSDISAIAHIAHEAGMKLIVDQAHGAHLRFFEKAGCGHDGTSEKKLYGHNLRCDHTPGASHGEDQGGPHMDMTMPPSAENCGADLVINSTHKTLCSLTQSAILNACGVDTVVLEDRLQMIQSTSPSYILMESLDINADILLEHGDELIADWWRNLLRFYSEAENIPGLRIMKVGGMDYTKINLDMSSLGVDGAALEKELMKYGIYSELCTGNILMCMTGIGNSSEDYDRLLNALTQIGKDLGTDGHSIDASDCSNPDPMQQVREDGSSDSPSRGSAHGGSKGGEDQDYSPWTARREWAGVPAKFEQVDLASAEGRVCATSLIPYPPGIPLVCPGEVITQKDIDHIAALREEGEKVIGIDQKGRISVGIQI